MAYYSPISQSTVYVVPQQTAIYQTVTPVTVAPLVQSFVSYPACSYVKTDLVQDCSYVSTAHSVNDSPVKSPLKGSSRLEYVPYQRKVIDYEQQIQTQIVPKERYITDYYAVEHTTDYIPQTYYDSYVDYVPVQRYQERTEYYPVESSRTVIKPQYY